MKTCSLEYCDRPHDGRGFCQAHRRQWVKTGETRPIRHGLNGSTVAQKLELNTRADRNCLRWTGNHSKAGYGMVVVGNRVKEYVHRLAYELAHGPVPDGMQVDHICRVRDCINIDHLQVVTGELNSQFAKHGDAHIPTVTCINGHRFTPDTTYVAPSGKRRCRVCRDARIPCATCGKPITRHNMRRHQVTVHPTPNLELCNA